MKTFIFGLFLLICDVHCVPISDQSSLVISTTESTNENQNKENDKNIQGIDISEMHIQSNVSNRFARTLVTSKVKNHAVKAEEATFTVVLPEKAFISEFIMEIKEKSYKAYVKEKKEAKDIYDKAVSQGQSAAHVSVSARDSNRFTVSVNVEPESKATFLLTYEELLERDNGYYELVINIHPGQIVKNLHTEVYINESRPLKFVKTPSLRSGNEIDENDDNSKLDPSSKINIINATSAVVTFNPDVTAQRNFAKNLGTSEDNGLAGQFIVQYEVERDPQGGEVLLQDGYFIHFFAPSDLASLPKHVIFVLDTSGSMSGTKITQLKDAMNSILNQLKGDNLLNIIDFNSVVNVWNIIDSSGIRALDGNETYDENHNIFAKLSEKEITNPIAASEKNVKEAIKIVNNFTADGGTNIIGALETALYLSDKAYEQHGDKYQPLIVFLTDGDPNVGLYSTEEIEKIVTKLNHQNHTTPIFSLSFGTGADKNFLRKLSLKNQGFSRHIYEGGDAAIQLEKFYKQISSPLLSNVNFKYNDKVSEVTRTKFPIFFWGSELVVTGRYDGKLVDLTFGCEITGKGPKGPLLLRPKIEIPVTPLERLWAYLTVKQILDKRDLEKNNTAATQQALNLALKYSFVTDVTSLVVVKPNETTLTDTENADKGSFNGGHFVQLMSNSFFQPQAAFISEDRIFQGDRVPSPNLITNIATTTHKPFTTIKDDLEVVKSLSKQLPWLDQAVHQNGSITLPQGTFEIGDFTTTVADNPKCPKTLQNVTGACTLLKDCPDMYATLTNLTVYSADYFCSLFLKYAGVCCPIKIYKL